MGDSLISSRRYCLTSTYPGNVVRTLLSAFHILCLSGKVAFLRVCFARLLKDRLQLGRHTHEVCQGIGLHLPHYSTAMNLIGVLCDTKLPSSLLIQEARHRMVKDLCFSRC